MRLRKGKGSGLFLFSFRPGGSGLNLLPEKGTSDNLHYLCRTYFTNTKYNKYMSYLIKPAGYKALLNLSQTEMGIKKINHYFQQNLSS